MEQLNRLIFGLTAGRKYATFFYGVYDPVSGLIQYANAGHIPPLLVRGGAIQELPSTGLPIGLFPASRLQVGEARLEPGDSLLLVTDGILEAGNPMTDDFGETRWTELAATLGGLPAEQAMAMIFDAVLTFEGTTPPSDDKTVVVLCRAAL